VCVVLEYFELFCLEMLPFFLVGLEPHLQPVFILVILEMESLELFV
jgi:hypothetical protein